MNKYLVWVSAFVFLFVGNACSERNKVGEVTLQKNEEAITTYINGNPQLVKAFEEVNGEKIYTFQKEYFEDGNLLKEGPLKDGKRNGEWKSYHRDGSLWSEGEFINGKMEGKTTSYYANGQIRYTGSFKNGVKDGEWRFYKEDGTLQEIKYFAQPGQTDTRPGDTIP